MPRGGSRLGAGRKPHTRKERWLGGHAGHRPLSLVTPDRQKTVDAGEPIVPDGVLAPAERVYWERWAPAAQASGNLTEINVHGFRLLCQYAAKADALWACIDARGYEQEKVTIDGSGQEHREYKANSLLSQWRGLIVRVEQGMFRYGILADGKVSVGAGDRDAEEEQLAKLLAVK